MKDVIYANYKTTWRRKLYHAQYVGDSEDTEFILDGDGDMIHANVCLCHARKPSECCCGCTSWCDENYYD